MDCIVVKDLSRLGRNYAEVGNLGYCVGAKLWKRFKSVLNFSLGFALALGIVLTAICYIFVNQIVGAFLTDVTAFDYAVEFARILLTTSWLFGVFYVLTNTLQAMGAGAASFVINLSRQGIIYIPALFILKSVLGLTGLVWAQPVTDVLSIGIAAILLTRTLKKMMKESEVTTALSNIKAQEVPLPQTLLT